MVDSSLETAMNNLYTAEWNVPKAAEYCGLSNDRCKELFSLYCKGKPLPLDCSIGRNHA